MVTNYVAACLFTIMVSGAALERPTPLRVGSTEDKNRFRAHSLALSQEDPKPPEAPKIDGIDPALQDAVDPTKVKDPAAQMEDGASDGAKSATLPPKQSIEGDKEADKNVKTAAELTGVKPNSHGHFSTWATALGINAIVISVVLIVFGGLRLKFPQVYSGNVLAQIAPMVPEETFVGWITASLTTTTEMAAESVGLDQAMLLEYCTMCCKILAIIGIPMVLILCPVHYMFGGGGLEIKEIGSVGMMNVIMKHPWMYYLHAVIVNCVTIAVIHEIYVSMTKFLELRYKWLKSLPAPRCVTVLVEGIPAEWRSDAKLREFFSAMFDGEHGGEPTEIKAAVMVKNAPKLKKLYEDQMMFADELSKAVDTWAKTGNDAEQRPTMKEKMCTGPAIDAIKYYEEKLKEIGPQVQEARKDAKKETDTVGELESPRWHKADNAHNTSTGFVTYVKRKKAAVCMNTVFSSKRDEWVITTPPPASDVLWGDLLLSQQKQQINALISYGLVFMVYMCFIPVVVIGTNIAQMVEFNQDYVQSMWASFAPGLALMLCLAFMPTILLLIFRSFGTLKADCFSQHKLQVWYFFFLFFFVILVTCIGQSLYMTFKEVVRKPETLMILMAEHMPSATQFYIDFLMLQWAEQAINFLRQTPLLKFIFFRFLYDDEMAKDMAEPEDQDYYGMGARSARFTINMCIAIIFSTLSPLIAIMGLVLFALCRLLYGYSMVFAETKKPDLGGTFFVSQLQHLLVGVGIYNIMMIGVLSPEPVGRARSGAPMLIALPALIYTIMSYRHFKDTFVWADLPYAEIVQHQNELKHEDNGLRYIQPEFIDEAQTAVIDAEAGASGGKPAKRRASMRFVSAVAEPTP